MTHEVKVTRRLFARCFGVLVSLAFVHGRADEPCEDTELLDLSERRPNLGELGARAVMQCDRTDPVNADDGFASSLSNYAQTVSADFAAGKTINVDGWVLSREEVRLCIRLSKTER